MTNMRTGSFVMEPVSLARTALVHTATKAQTRPNQDHQEVGIQRVAFANSHH